MHWEMHVISFRGVTVGRRGRGRGELLRHLVRRSIIGATVESSTCPGSYDTR